MKTFEFTSIELHAIKQAIKVRHDECSDKLDNLKGIPKSDYRDYETNYYIKELNNMVNLLHKLEYSGE